MAEKRQALHPAIGRGASPELGVVLCVVLLSELWWRVQGAVVWEGHAGEPGGKREHRGLKFNQPYAFEP